MPDRPDERGLSIGDSVRFAHRGRTIGGHLYRRQGRRRLATVIDGEDRLWKVPEEALSPSDAPRRETMMTGTDAARARWRVGDRVAFTDADGARHSGRIVKLNPTQARVRAGRALWNVPYGGLSDAGSGKRRARDGAERLARIAALARELMDEHGLDTWTFAFLEAERRLGDCNHRDRVIRLGRSPRARRRGRRDQGHDPARDRPCAGRPRSPPRARVEGHGAVRIGATPRASVYERKRR